LFLEDNGATLSNNNVPKRHQSRPTNIPSLPSQYQQSSLPAATPQPSSINNNRVSADLNSYNSNNNNNNKDAALEPIDENRPQQRNRKNDDKFRAAEGLDYFFFVFVWLVTDIKYLIFFFLKQKVDANQIALKKLKKFKKIVRSEDKNKRKKGKK
jgi:hypothetical protein